jgi:hypothetical protein
MSRFAMLLAVCLPATPSAWADETETTRVVGRRPPGTASERRADRTELDQVIARTAEDFLQLVPGLHVVQHGSEGKGHQFFVRGFDAVHGSDVRVSVEGIPLNEPSNIHGHGYVDLAFVIPELVLAVDAHKGAYALDQGDFGTAGAIDFKLGVSTRNQGVQTSYQAGSTNRHRGLVVYAPNGADFVAAEGLYDAGFGQNRAAQRGTIMSRWTLHARNGQRLELLGAAYHAGFGLPGAVRADDVDADRIGLYDAYLDDTNGTSSRGLLALTHRLRKGAVRWQTRAFGHVRRLRLDENFTGFAQFPQTGDRHIQTHDAIEGGLQSRLALKLARSLTARGHLGWRGGRIDQAEQFIDTTGADTLLRRELDAFQQTAQLALGVTWRPMIGLRVEAGGRLDTFNVQGTDQVTDQALDGWTTALSPRLQIVASPHIDWEFFAAYGRGFRSPEASAFRDGVDVTVADNAEAGFRYTPSRYVSVGLAAFGVQIERETLFDHTAAVTIEQGATRRWGGEIDARWDPVTWLRFDADIAVARARFIDTDDRVPNAPRLLATLGSTFTHQTGWEASIHALWVGARPLAFGGTAGDAVIIDTGVGYRSDAFRVRLDIENPLNQAIREGEAQFASRWRADQVGGQLPANHYFAAAPLNARLTATAWF